MKNFFFLIILAISNIYEKSESKLKKYRKVKQNHLKIFSGRRYKITKLSVNRLMRKNTLLGVSLILTIIFFPLFVSEKITLSTSYSGTTGSLAWTFTAGDVFYTDPALGDVDGDGDMEILIGSEDNKVYCLDGTKGAEEWAFTTGDTVFSSPTLGDIDGDGNMEILVSSYDHKVYCLVGNGDPWAIPGPWPCSGGSALHHSNSNDYDDDNLPDIL